MATNAQSLHAIATATNRLTLAVRDLEKTLSEHMATRNAHTPTARPRY